MVTARSATLPSSPFSPFSPVAQLFLTPADSELRTFLEEAHAFISQCPSLVDAIEADLDRHALSKKAVRLADEQWLAQRLALLPGVVAPPAGVGSPPLTLMNGRPRTPGYVVLIAMLLRGYCGAGFKSDDVASAMAESITLRVFFANLQLEMPGRSTLTELVNAVTNETRLLVLDAQIAQAMDLKLDDFAVILQDSTHVEANTAWPTDSRLLLDLVRRLIRMCEELGRVDLPKVESNKLQPILTKMTSLNRKIELSKGKKDAKRERTRRYKKLLQLATQAHSILQRHITPLAAALELLDVRPSRKATAARVFELLRADLDALATVRATCEARVLREEKVSMSEKVLSLCDSDAGFISKGQRDPVIGYKPQVARSGEGFIVGLRLPKGNASDSKQLVPMIDEIIARTRVVPKVVSVDDGYASADNLAALEARTIEVISINGAKGRALTSRADWESEPFAEARSKRSAVESLMFTLKHGFHFGEVARRGLSAVYAELLEKALAYNLCVTTRLRRAAAKNAARVAA